MGGFLEKAVPSKRTAQRCRRNPVVLERETRSVASPGRRKANTWRRCANWVTGKASAADPPVVPSWPKKSRKVAVCHQNGLFLSQAKKPQRVAVRGPDGLPVSASGSSAPRSLNICFNFSPVSGSISSSRQIGKGDREGGHEPAPRKPPGSGWRWVRSHSISHSPMSPASKRRSSLRSSLRSSAFPGSMSILIC